MTTTQILMSVISLLCAIIGFFIVRNFKVQDETNKLLRGSVEKLSDSITGLSGVVLKYEERHDQLRREFDEHKEEHKLKKTG